MALSCDTKQGEQRRQELKQYLSMNVLAGKFICRDYRACRSSYKQIFYEGQLHHVGRFYDLESDGIPLRVVVVGQEYGHSPPRVTLQARYKMILSSGLDHRFLAGYGYPARNPHMKGTTNALRLVFGLTLGTDFQSEFLHVGSERCHIFDAFALVNYLLCSAVLNDDSRRGQATKTMKTNCKRHFKESLRILEPTVVVVQGEAFWSSYVRDAFDSVKHLALEIYEARLGLSKMYVATFAHPSAGPPKNWGTNDHTPYLLDTVKPSIDMLRGEILGLG